MAGNVGDIREGVGIPGWVSLDGAGPNDADVWPFDVWDEIPIHRPWSTTVGNLRFAHTGYNRRGVVALWADELRRIRYPIGGPGG